MASRALHIVQPSQARQSTPSEESSFFDVVVAGAEHLCFVDMIVEHIAQSAVERGTGRGKRTPEEISEKILKGQSVIALTKDGAFVGFCYVAAYGEGNYFANSALIIAKSYRGQGISRQIKHEAFALGLRLFPKAIPFTITTSSAVMKLNSELGYRPVSFSEITDDIEFWKGCEGCVNFDVLKRMNGKNCLCTAMRRDPPTKKRLKRVSI